MATRNDVSARSLTGTSFGPSLVLCCPRLEHNLNPDTPAFQEAALALTEIHHQCQVLQQCLESSFNEIHHRCQVEFHQHLQFLQQCLLLGCDGVQALPSAETEYESGSIVIGIVDEGVLRRHMNVGLMKAGSFSPILRRSFMQSNKALLGDIM